MQNCLRSSANCLIFGVHYTFKVSDSWKSPPLHILWVLDFTYFIKVKDAIDPSQAYFWTRKWQEMEREVDRDKERGDIIGDGSVSDLLEELNK